MDMLSRKTTWSRQFLLIGAIIALVYFGVSHFGKKPEFDNLALDNQSIVVAQHNKALELYKQRKYADALNEIRKVFEITRDYKDSKEIEWYSKMALKVPPQQ